MSYLDADLSHEFTTAVAEVFRRWKAMQPDPRKASQREFAAFLHEQSPSRKFKVPAIARQLGRLLEADSGQRIQYRTLRRWVTNPDSLLRSAARWAKASPDSHRRTTRAFLTVTDLVIHRFTVELPNLPTGFDEAWRRVTRYPEEHGWPGNADGWDIAIMLGDALNSDAPSEETTPELERELRRRGLPALFRDPKVLDSLRAFRTWCDPGRIPQEVFSAALGRILGPLAAQGRTGGIAPGWPDLGLRDRKDYLRHSIEREKIILRGFTSEAARARYESRLPAGPPRETALTRDTERLLEQERDHPVIRHGYVAEVSHVSLHYLPVEDEAKGRA